MNVNLDNVLGYAWGGLNIVLDAILFALIILVLSCLKYTQSNFLREKGLSFLIFLCAIILIK